MKELDENTRVDADELAEWTDANRDEIEKLVAEGIIRRDEAGLFPLKLSIANMIEYWRERIFERGGNDETG